MKKQTKQTLVGGQGRIPLEKRVVVLIDGTEIKFSDLHPQRQQVLYELSKKLSSEKVLNGNCDARIELGRELDIQDMYHKMQEDNGFEIMKSFFAGDILGRCDSQGRIIYKSGKSRHSMDLGFSIGLNSAKGYVNFCRNKDYEMVESSVLVYACPKDCKYGTRGRMINDKDESCFGHCVVGYRGVGYTQYLVNFQDGSMNWSSLEPGVIHLEDNEGKQEIVKDPNRIRILRGHAREMWALGKMRGDEFPSLKDMWSFKK